ncbi:MAG TPA: filamentous hemagglutinin N-terminal domain-containing protein [Verrucomicrobiae bacterium]|nr:filamentous hemagglutinin N-terminal domain-containing protein [Verrucomicrobiae bacterium]
MSTRSLRRWPGIFGVAVICGFAGRPAQANPVGGSVAQGSATFNTSGSKLTIQTSDHAFINWQSFNIGLGETTTFVQPSSSSVVWNQIHDSNPSQILGSLNANGYVILQNQAGFYIGGQASITTHGLMMTTSPIPMPDLSDGGAWSFSAPPPTASIINYGQINVGTGCPAFLIADKIENYGSISAPQGNIGLYAGQQVMLSERPDGRGLSATVTLPQGSVDNQGKLIADAGTIEMRAQVVNQGGLVQANSVREVNGVIELVASDSLNIGSGSVISAKGDTQGVSDAGSVTLQSANQYSDSATSRIEVSGGAQGGDGGHIEISAQQFDDLQTQIHGEAANGFLAATMFIDPQEIKLSSTGDNSSGTVNADDPPSSGSATTLTLNVNSLNTLISSGSLSHISLSASDGIEVATDWILPASKDPTASLTLTAGGSIVVDDKAGIQAGNNWSFDFTAGPQNLTSRPTTANTDGIYLNGSGFLQTQNGSITLNSANDVLVNTGAIRTLGGGAINVTADFGNVNTGIDPAGFVFTSVRNRGTVAPPPYYTVSPTLGGISTAAGGSVTIDAINGSVASYLPTQADYDNSVSRSDAGTGAFGGGNVTITAGQSISGHYVVANGTGMITSTGGNIGAPVTKNGDFDLSLVNGSWTVNAPKGYIYLREVRNPNGIFNDSGAAGTFVSYHNFDYTPTASVDLEAGLFVEITGGGPRPSEAPVPVIFPPSLTIETGLMGGPASSSGLTLDVPVILFPSADGNLNINVKSGGSIQGNNNYLEMSDSGATQWTDGAFLSNDHAATPPQLNNKQPVEITVAGDADNITFYTDKETVLTVDGDMNNSSFIGENLHTGDNTIVTVHGQIYNTPSLTFENLDSAIISANPLQPLMWDSVFELAVDPSVMNLNVNTFTSTAALKDVLRASYLLFPQVQSRYALGANPGFIYDPTSGSQRIGFNGNLSVLSASQIMALENGSFTVLKIDANGNPLFTTDGKLETMTYTFVPGSVISQLVTDSSKVPTTPASGFQIGGPGTFTINAGSIELGDSPGIMSWGIGNGTQASGVDYSTLTPYTPVGAEVDVTVTGNLSMLTSRIASTYGGDVNVTSTGGELDLGSQDFFITTGTQLAYGIFTSGHSDVSVSAFGDVNINGSRIAAYNGGAVSVTSTHGDVEVGSGGNNYVYVPLVSKDSSGTPNSISDQIYGSGIVATSLPDSLSAQGGVSLPGDITVETPRGNIHGDTAGILQLALGGDVAGGPTITLVAGTPAMGDTPAIPGNIDLGTSGLIGGTVNITAQGNVGGTIISSQNSTINTTGSFSGTLLSAGSATVAAGGSVSGTVIGISGASVGGANVSASVLGQNVSVNGGAAQSTLGTTAAATSTAQSAAGTATADAKDQTTATADTTSSDDDLKKRKLPVLARWVSRVTVILPPQ